MHVPRSALAALLAFSCTSCGLSYEQRQDRFRERYITGCQVHYGRPAHPTANPISIQPTAISEIIESSRDQLQYCYLEALELWPQLEGRVVIDFAVQADGRVAAPAVSMPNSTIVDASIGCCMTRVAQAWKFPAPPDGKPFDVEYPFELVTDILKMRFSTSVTTAEPFKSRFPSIVILAPATSTRTSFQYPR